MRTTQILLIVALVFFVSIAFIEAKREGPQRSERKSVNKVVPPRFLEEVNIPKHKDPSQLRIDESPLKSLEGVNLVEVCC